MDIVSGSRNAFLERLSYLLSGRNLPIRAIRKSEIEKLRKDMYVLNRLVEEADERIDGDKSQCVRIYTGQMREVANLIEDVLVEYDLLSAKDKAYLRRVGLNFLGMIRSLGKLNRNINNINTLLINIHSLRRTRMIYGLGQVPSREREHISSAAAGVGDHVALVAAPLEEVLVGEVDDLTCDLLVGGEQKLSAIAVLGMGGIGKTTLVKRMYRSKEAMSQFEIRAWINVCELNNPLEILRLMLVELHGGLYDERMSIDGIVRMATRLLRGKRYLLVLDDMRDQINWLRAREFLPDDGNGSRVIVTTRDSYVAASCDSVHKMNILSEDESWELFCRTVFGFDCCPDDLRELSAEILGTCGGHPLAIRTVAGYLYTKEKEEWRMMNGDFRLLTVDHIFDSLPPRLKKCFMYVSIFPKGSMIHEERLLRLWIAEGFVREMPGKTLEEVSVEYLEELEDRGMLQTCQGLYGIDRFFQVHDLIHKMVRRKAANRGFCDVNDGEVSRLRVTCRRIVLSSISDVKKALNATKESQVRSVFLWNTRDLDESILVRLFKKFYLLTMLDIDNSPLKTLPREVGDLPCLKYLSLHNTGLRKLPKTVRKLSRLEMLILSGSRLVELPVEVAKLVNLRHLQVSHVNINRAGLKIKKGIGALANLHTLETVDAKLSGVYVIQELKKLKQLRTLKVSKLTTNLSMTLCACIDEMEHLESLHLHSTKNLTLNLETIWSPPTQLQRLVLKGELLSLPDWIPRLQNLRLICLCLSNLDENPVNRLRHLPNLESLWLYGAYRGTRLAFEDGFEKLRLLFLREMWELEEVVIAEDTMPLLEELRIGPSPSLNEVPAGVSCLTCLKVLSFYDMPDTFVRSLQPNDGSEFLKVKNIQSVLFWYKQASGAYVSYQLGEPELLHRLCEGSGRDRKRVRDAFRMSFSYSDDDEGDMASLLSSFDSECTNISDDYE